MKRQVKIMRTFREELNVFKGNNLDLLKIEVANVVENYKCVYYFLLNDEIYEIICSFVYKYKMDTSTEIDTHDIVEALCGVLGNYEIALDDIENDYETTINVISRWL